MNSKELTEIGSEKEILEFSRVQAMGENNNITQSRLQEALDDNAGYDKTKVMNAGETFIIKFIETNRYYEIDNTGNVKNIEVIVDNNPGNIKLGINGETLQGSESSPFEIWCIEDLIEFSKNYQEYETSYIILGQTLDFKLEIHYADSQSQIYGDINNNGEIQTIIEEMQTGIGYTPINSFSGTFDGNNYYIKNMFQNGSDGGIFKSLTDATVQNLNVTGKIEVSGSAGGISSGATNSNIINCNNLANINTASSVGGILGNASTTVITDCSNDGDLVNKNPGNYGGTGGMVGAGTLVTMMNCYNTSNVLIKSDEVAAGGMIGYIYHSSQKCTVYNSYNLAEIRGKEVGGMAGYVYSGHIDCINCYTVRKVKWNYCRRNSWYWFVV